MRALRTALGTVLLFATAFATVQDKAYDLHWKPKQDQAFGYKMTLRALVEGSPLDIKSDLLLKVLKVAPNGDYTVESRFKNGVVTFKNEDQKMDGENQPEVQTFNAKGELLTPEKEDATEDPMGYVLGQIAEFSQPEKAVRIGDKWEKVIKPNQTKKLPPARATFQFVGMAKVGKMEVLNVKYTFTQREGAKPISADGYFYIDPADGLMMVFDAKIENLPFDRESPPTTARLRLERVPSMLGSRD